MGRATARRLARGALVTVVLATGALVLPAQRAEAAGITTHAWMAMEAVELVEDPALRALLTANIEQLRAGATFPDGGYVPGNLHGEEAHWQRFHDAYAERIRARDDCGDLTDPDGPCAPIVAHLLGAVAHGMGDQTWDWLFEPHSPDRDEYYLPPEWSAIAGPGGQELQLDLVAIADHGRPTHAIPPVPSPETVLGAFADAGFVGATPAALELGTLAAGVIMDVEATLAAQHIEALRAAMPWMSANLVTAPGGVRFSAVAIAGAMDSMWGRLLGDQPPTEVSITYPADGERRVPATGWVRTYIAGSNPGSGGARTRITAALTSARPYVPSASGPGSVPRELPPGAMTLVEEATGEPVPLLPGYPRSVPYDPGAGEHLVDIQPGVDLAPCTWYVAGVTEALIDARGLPVVPTTWRFRTGTGPDGGRCPDDPFLPGDPLPPEAALVQRMHRQVLGRDADGTELPALLGALDAGGHRALAGAVVDGEAHRRQLAAGAFQAALRRPPTPDEQAWWAAWLADHSLRAIADRLFALPEAYAAAGGTGAGFVDAVHRAVLGRAPTEAELAAWAPAATTALGRRALVLAVVAGGETADIVTTAAYRSFLGREPTPIERVVGALRVVATGDFRPLWADLLAGDEYRALAPPAAT